MNISKRNIKNWRFKSSLESHCCCMIYREENIFLDAIASPSTYLGRWVGGSVSGYRACEKSPLIVIAAAYYTGSKQKFLKENSFDSHCCCCILYSVLFSLKNGHLNCTATSTSIKVGKLQWNTNPKKNTITKWHHKVQLGLCWHFDLTQSSKE